VGIQPTLTFVTAGELAQWTKLRHWGPGNLAMPGSWLADKPVIPGSKALRPPRSRAQPRPSSSRSARPNASTWSTS
jgi:hypothetical protein